MNIKVKFFAYFRGVFGGSEKTLFLPAGATVRGALDALCDTESRRAEIFEGGALKPRIIVMKNGAPAALDAAVVEDDTLAVFPFMAGG
jgi:molybdopterin converting factor small subunit